MRPLLITCCAASLAFTQSILASEVIEEIRVTSHPLSDQGLAQSSTVLSDDELSQKLQGSLGETLANEPGLRSASFGSAVGRPVIHGLGGARVKTTEDRIDSLDVSVTSGDHAVTIEPFIANTITVLKGASTLLYGSNAIGGVVDIETGRIPKQQMDAPLAGKLEVRAADNADANTAALRLDGKLSENVLWHADATVRGADDYEIPGLTESAALRASEGEEHEEEEEDESTLAGSELDSKSFALGTSYVGDRGFVGISVSKIDSEYGLVGGHGHEEEGHEEDEHGDEEEGHDEHEEDEHGDEDEHEHEELFGELEEENGLIDLEQTRVDLEFELNNPLPGFESINFRLGVNDYQHKELESNGEVGTVFNNDAWESRVQLMHLPVAGFSGAVGLQLNNREFSAIGEEAFIPPVESDSAGLFWVGEKQFENFDLETGFRFEEVKHKPTAAGMQERDFSSASASVGLVVPVSEGFNIAALLDYTSRAPSIEELFSDGPHLATQSFEIGNTELDEESATGISLSASYQTRFVNISGTLYQLDFQDFIYQAAQDFELDELPVFIYQQDDAKFTGIDLSAEFHLGVVAGGDLDLSFMYDQVRARLDNNNSNRDLPRIPADRYGIEMDWTDLRWSIVASFTRVEAQNKVAELELPTESYNDIRLYISRKIVSANSGVELFLQGRNLGDDEQRQHVSFVKDVAPAPGRRIEVGLRWAF